MTRQSMNLNRRQSPTTSSLSNGLLQRKCACGQRTIAGGECEDCQKKRSSDFVKKYFANSIVN